MDNLFGLLFFTSFVCLIIGLIKPTAFAKFIKGELTRKKIGKIFGISTVAFFVLIGITAEPTKDIEQIAQQSIIENNQKDIDNTDITPVVAEKTEKTTEPTPIPTKPKDTNPIPTEIKTKTVKPITPIEPAIPAEPEEPATKTKRENILIILKERATAEWGTDYEMVKYEYDNQVEAYDWVVTQTKYLEIMSNSKNEWGNDYEMVQYEYNNQVEAYEWILIQTKYPNIMTNAKQEWGNDYEMVKYEYNNQVEAYESL